MPRARLTTGHHATGRLTIARPSAARIAGAPLAIVLTAALAACTSAAAPGWTFEPPPPATPAPSASAAPSGSAGPSASGAPSASASAGPSESAAASGSGAPSAPAGATLKLAAQNIAYDQATLTAPADTAFVIEFTNDDAGVPHNVSIKDGSGMEMFKGDIFNGVDTKQYQVPALPAGTYTFFCAVHPNMTGTLTVQ